MNNNICFVTGIWDLDRSNAPPGWCRDFEHYINHFIILLQTLQNHNLYIYIDPKYEEMVWKYRSKHNTIICFHKKEDFNGNFFPFFHQVQKIRNSPQWYNQVGWLRDSAQGSLEYYNPMVMSKMFMLHNAKCLNAFNSDYFYWIDGGIANTMSLGYFNNEKVIKNLINISDKFLFICFPYETNTEIHGFDIDAMCQYAHNKKVNRVARGGFFGGHKNYISAANNLYYHLLDTTLSNNYMGTEESVFTLMTYLDPETYKFEIIEENGLIYVFFENLQNKEYLSFIELNKVRLYLNTYNSPEQLLMVLESFKKYAPDLLANTEKVLINNSTKEDLFQKYNSIVDQYGFIEQIKQGNIGVCGGRQLAAEHFANSDAKYMIFFEDDMLIDYSGNCKFGFKKEVTELLSTIIKIMNKEQYDFLKLSFSEFYGNNSLQWSWHNVPPDKRIEYFGDISDKPFTKFDKIKSLNSTPYAEGEIYYCNWPIIIGKEGNKKLFLDTKWNYPYEQTWMSHAYTLIKEKTIRAGVLLASPITHNREHHYDASERREN